MLDSATLMAYSVPYVYSKVRQYNSCLGIMKLISCSGISFQATCALNFSSVFLKVLPFESILIGY